MECNLIALSFELYFFVLYVTPLSLILANKKCEIYLKENFKFNYINI